VIGDLDSVLGLDLIRKGEAKRELLKKQNAVAGEFTIIAEDGTPDPEIEARNQARQDAKKAKDYALADAIREELKASGRGDMMLTIEPHLQVFSGLDKLSVNHEDLKRKYAYNSSFEAFTAAYEALKACM